MIKLFPENSTNFNGLGLGVLNDAISCAVTENLDKSFELEMEYPITGTLFSSLKEELIIVADANDYSSQQAFRIYEITRQFEGTVLIRAQHISYDMCNIIIGDFNTEPLINDCSENEDEHVAQYSEDWLVDSEGTVIHPINLAIYHVTALNKDYYWSDDEEEYIELANLFDYVLQKIQNGDVLGNNPFRLHNPDNIEFDEDVTSYTLGLPTNMRSVLFGDDDKSLYSKKKFEVVFNNFDVYLYEKRGSNRGFSIRYAKNMIGVECTADATACYTDIYPYYYKTESVSSGNSNRYYATAYVRHSASMSAKGADWLSWKPSKYNSSTGEWDDEEPITPNNTMAAVEIGKDGYTYGPGEENPEGKVYHWLKLISGTGKYKQLLSSTGDYPNPLEFISYSLGSKTSKTEEKITYTDIKDYEIVDEHDVRTKPYPNGVYPIVTTPTRHKVLTLDLTSQCDENLSDGQSITPELVVNQLLKYLEEDDNQAKLTTPKISLSVEFVKLSSSPEYEEYKNLEVVMLGDTVKIYYGDLGLNVSDRVIAYTYDVLRGMYETIDISAEQEDISMTAVTTNDPISTLKNDINYTTSDDASKVSYNTAMNTVVEGMLNIQQDTPTSESEEREEVTDVGYMGTMLSTAIAKNSNMIDELVANKLFANEAYIKKAIFDYIETTELIVKGNITATSGKISDFNIGLVSGNPASLYTGNHSTLGSVAVGLYLGNDGISFGNGTKNFFSVSSTGAMIEGSIAATTGSIAGYTISNSALYTGNHSALSDGNPGIYIGTDGMSLYNSSGTLMFRLTSTPYFAGEAYVQNGKVSDYINVNNNGIYSGNHSAYGDSTEAGFFLGKDLVNNKIGLAVSNGTENIIDISTAGAHIKGEINATSGTIGSNGNLHITDNGVYYGNCTDFDSNARGFYLGNSNSDFGLKVNSGTGTTVGISSGGITTGYIKISATNHDGFVNESDQSYFRPNSSISTYTPDDYTLYAPALLYKPSTVTSISNKGQLIVTGQIYLNSSRWSSGINIGKVIVTATATFVATSGTESAISYGVSVFVDGTTLYIRNSSNSARYIFYTCICEP